MNFVSLQEEVWQANMSLVKAGLVVLTWGNVSGIDRASGIVAIKPSGVDYERMRPSDIVLVSLETGQAVDGSALRPSSDTPTHLVIYRGFPGVSGVVHSHSTYATGWAQAGREIPCYGTTHADTFHGPVPLCRPLTPDEIARDYEGATGDAIIERFRLIDPAHVPGVLLPNHGPFAWGKSPDAAVEHAVILEEVARMAAISEALRPGLPLIPAELQEKHFSRKHGPAAYYGQRK